MYWFLLSDTEPGNRDFLSDIIENYFHPHSPKQETIINPHDIADDHRSFFKFDHCHIVGNIPGKRREITPVEDHPRGDFSPPGHFRPLVAIRSASATYRRGRIANIAAI